MLRRFAWNLLLTIRNLTNRNNIWIHPTCRVSRTTSLEGGSRIQRQVAIERSKIGYGTYIGNDSILNDTAIGRYCSIAEHVVVVAGQHPTREFISTHPAFFSTQKQAGFTYVDRCLFEERKVLAGGFQVRIGHDVWIGAHVKIMEGVTIGDGVIIGASALVTKDLEPFGIYVGVPARLVRYRFDAETIASLLALKWWNQGEAWLRSNAPRFRSASQFLAESGDSATKTFPTAPIAPD